MSFAVQKLLNLIRSSFLIFAFVSFGLGERSKEMLLYFMSKCSTYVFSMSFTVSGLTFGFLIHFEFYLYIYEKMFYFIILQTSAYFSQNH